MPRKRKATLVWDVDAERFSAFKELIDALKEFQVDKDHFFDWFEVKLKEYIAEFGPVRFNEKSREFEGDMPKKIKTVLIEGDTGPILSEWYNAVPQLKAIKEREHALRQTLVSRLFNAEKFEGTETIDIGNGYKLKSSKSQNVSVLNSQEKINELCGAILQISEIQAIAQRLIKWSPEVSTPAYRELCEASDRYPALKTFMAALFTVKPGMPELEIIAPETEGAKA